MLINHAGTPEEQIQEAMVPTAMGNRLLHKFLLRHGQPLPQEILNPSPFDGQAVRFRQLMVEAS